MSITRTELKNLKALNSAAGRREQGRYLAEGIRLLEESVRNNCLPKALFYSEAHLSERGSRLLSEVRSRNVATESISSRQLASISDTRSPQGVIGVFDLPPTPTAELFSGHHRRILLCEAISDPGNLGTLIRSARAFDFSLIALTGQSADPYSPKVVRSTAGALFGQKICMAEGHDITRLAGSSDTGLVAASHRGDSDQRKLKSVLMSRTLIVAIGSESKGLSESLIEAADVVWRIDHNRAVESLNAAVAGSIIMKQVFDGME